MRETIQTKAGTVEVLAHEPGVVPGVIRIKAGPGGLLSIFLSPEEAEKIAEAAESAAWHARRALKFEQERAEGGQ